MKGATLKMPVYRQTAILVAGHQINELVAIRPQTKCRIDAGDEGLHQRRRRILRQG